MNNSVNIIDTATTYTTNVTKKKRGRPKKEKSTEEEPKKLKRGVKADFDYYGTIYAKSLNDSIEKVYDKTTNKNIGIYDSKNNIIKFVYPVFPKIPKQKRPRGRPKTQCYVFIGESDYKPLGDKKWLYTHRLIQPEYNNKKVITSYKINSGEFICIVNTTFHDFDEVYRYDDRKQYIHVETDDDEDIIGFKPLKYIKIDKSEDTIECINHSCNPTAFFAIEEGDDDNLYACLYAIDNLEPNDELTVDYGWYAKDPNDFTKCICGSEKCKGVIERNVLPTK
mgnify:CR=1 FL=1